MSPTSYRTAPPRTLIVTTSEHKGQTTPGGWRLWLRTGSLGLSHRANEGENAPGETAGPSTTLLTELRLIG
jgi:hypothetical protein